MEQQQPLLRGKHPTRARRLGPHRTACLPGDALPASARDDPPDSRLHPGPKHPVSRISSWIGSAGAWREFGGNAPIALAHGTEQNARSTQGWDRSPGHEWLELGGPPRSGHADRTSWEPRGARYVQGWGTVLESETSMLARRLAASLLALFLAFLLTGSPARSDEPSADEEVFLSASELFRGGKPREAIDALAPLLDRGGRLVPQGDLPESSRLRGAPGVRDGRGDLRRGGPEAPLGGAEAGDRGSHRLLRRRAREKPDPDDPGAPKPDYAKAVSLYRRALEMEIGRSQKDEVMFKTAVDPGGGEGPPRRDRRLPGVPRGVRPRVDGTRGQPGAADEPQAGEPAARRRPRPRSALRPREVAARDEPAGRRSPQPGGPADAAGRLLRRHAGRGRPLADPPELRSATRLRTTWSTG